MRLVLLDAGPVGFAVAPRITAEFEAWLAHLAASRIGVVIPEIADYEVRRELVRGRAEASLSRLDQLRISYDYEPITTDIMHRAASFWAQSRNRGRPLADRHALDADCILAATAEAVAARGHGVTIATTNVGHLSQLTSAALWSEIRS